MKKKLKSSMILRPVKHGKNCAVVLTDEMLDAAGFTKSGQLQVTINPSGGIILQSIDEDNEDVSQTAFKKVKRKYSQLFRRLADR